MTDHVHAAGHAGCLAYARQAIWLMFLANALAYSGEPGMVPMLGIMAAGGAAGAAYFGQQLFNAYDGAVQGIMPNAPTEEQQSALETVFRRGQFCQVVSILLAIASGLIALVAA